MGLDWSPLARAREGHEAEFADLFRELEGRIPPRRTGLARWFRPPKLLTKAERDQRIARLQEISEAPFERLGAPQVGHDAAADAWLRDQLSADGKADQYETAREKMSGYRVLDLLPECDGFPVYSNYRMVRELDRYSFRGQFLRDAADFLGEELMAQAYKSCLPDELQAFGEALRERTRAFAEPRSLGHLEQVRGTEGLEDGTDPSKVHIAFSAAKWCLYWAARGHGLETWF